jgi:hypothetical protein
MQGSGLNSGDGGTVILNNSYAYSINVAAGNSDAMSGNGGIVQIASSSISATIDAYASESATSQPGTGGHVIIAQQSVVAGTVNASANDYMGGDGGDGGVIELKHSEAASLLANGGSSSDPYTGGAGGIIKLTNVSVDTVIGWASANGGTGLVPGATGQIQLLYTPPDILGTGFL